MAAAVVEEATPEHAAPGGAAEGGRALDKSDREKTPSTVASSQYFFDDPSQTIILFDWDETLFPTTHVFERWGLRTGVRPGEREDLPEQAIDQLQKWSEALEDYLKQACTLSEHCVIITNAKRPWVQTCIDRFAPSLAPLFSSDSGPKVVYASERLEPSKHKLSPGADLRPVRTDTGVTREERDEQLTAAKFCAMRDEVSTFYSRYPGQTWKNVLSLGDMPYERNAVLDVTFRHTPSSSKECVRTKTLLLPTGPTISEITLRLQFSRLMLPAYVSYDGDFDLDLQSAPDPLEAIGRAIGMKELTNVPFPRHAWGRMATPLDDEIAMGLCDVAVAVHNSLVE